MFGVGVEFGFLCQRHRRRQANHAVGEDFGGVYFGLGSGAVFVAEGFVATDAIDLAFYVCPVGHLLDVDVATGAFDLAVYAFFEGARFHMQLAFFAFANFASGHGKALITMAFQTIFAASVGINGYRRYWNGGCGR